MEQGQESSDAGLYGELFELLSSTWLKPAAHSAPNSFSTCPVDALEKIASYQIRLVDDTLKQQFDLHKGLNDKRVVVLNITPDVFEYPCATLPSTVLSAEPELRIPVVLGILPPIDAVEVELLRNEKVIAQVSDRGADTPSPQTLLSLRGPMPLPHYWNAYAEYLRNRPRTSHSEPVTPGQYRELLESRQRVRDRRLQCLREYTGVRRVKARDDDVLADCQAIFFRFVEMMLHDAGKGIAALAADPMVLDHPDMTGLRKCILNACDQVIVDEIVAFDFNAAPVADSSEGDALPLRRNGRCGTALFFMMKTGERVHRDDKVWHRKHADADTALTALKRHSWEQQTPLTPDERSQYSFSAPRISREYLAWPSLLDIAAIPPINGLMEKRRGALVDIDKQRLEQRMRRYFDTAVSWTDIQAMGTGLSEQQSRFEPKAVRDAALAAGVVFNENAVRPYAAKPFDDRWCYHSTTKFLWSDPKPNFAALCESDNSFFVTRAGKVVNDEGVPFFFTPFLGDSDLLRGHSYYFPSWYLRDNGNRAPNISGKIQEYLSALGIPSAPLEISRQVWNHVLAMAFAPAYLRDNAAGIRRDWPRIPFPTAPGGDRASITKTRTAFLDSCRLGSMVADLLNPLVGVNGVTQGTIRPELESMGVLWDTEKGAPVAADESAVIPITKEWGKWSKDKSVLLSHGGQWSRGFTLDERQRLEKGALAVGVRPAALYSCLGEEFYELYLNDTTSIRNVPIKVYHYIIGGYPVLKKWLSYRETSILGRLLTVGEMRIFTEMVRRIAALLLLEPRLNHNYAVIRDTQMPFSNQ